MPIYSQQEFVPLQPSKQSSNLTFGSSLQQQQTGQLHQLPSLLEQQLLATSRQSFENLNNNTQSDAATVVLTSQQSPQATPQIVPPPVDKNVDLDGDGALSLTEVQYAAFVHHGLSSSVVENLFNQVDKNKDGYLTSIEFNEIRPLVLAKAENAAHRYLQVRFNFIF